MPVWFPGPHGDWLWRGIGGSPVALDTEEGHRRAPYATAEPDGHAILRIFP
jgi:hypothetical protein